MRALLEHARSLRRRADFGHGEYRELADGQFPEFRLRNADKELDLDSDGDVLARS
ncbi:hypothetical protein ACH4TQ_45940 [Streptomyces sp. NPDC021218]|uniref:hypothetical protein n=1 Tax=Streptomyces sp. NPDC021218 TaxID=3365119 RepID=UPI0037ACDBE4